MGLMTKQRLSPKPSNFTMKRRGVPSAIGRSNVLILCPSVTKNSGALEALYALYYLPSDYRLRIEGAGDFFLDEINKVLRDDALAERVEWSAEETAPLVPDATSPFALADVVVYGNARQLPDDTPAQTLVVFNLANRQTVPEDRRFVVCPNEPEALATAILRVTQ